jgi:long-chain acyl-CoA synthetase
MTAHSPDEIRARLIGPGGAFEVVREDVRGESMLVFLKRARSLRALLDETARFGDRIALAEGEVRLSFDQLRERVEQLAATLARDHGIRSGDRVALFAANRWEWIVAFWAIASLGSIPVLMNGFWTAEEFVDAARVVDPALVIGDGPRLERARKLQDELPMLDLDEAMVAPDASRSRSATERVSAGTPPPIREDDPAFLIFTSGTTGRAKAVTVPHRAVCGFHQVSGFSEAYGKALFGLPLPQAGIPAPPSDDVVLATSPLFHVSMLYGAVVMSVVKGSCVVLLPGRFDPERVLQAIERERITLWMALGSAAPRVATFPRLAEFDTSSLRQLGIGGAPVSPAVQSALRSAFPTAAHAVGMGYTSTEAGAVIASIGGPEFALHPTSTGRVTLTTEVELRDANGRPAPPDGEGEVHVRSPYVMLGYWNDPAATAKALKPGGWLALGDIARFEGDLLFIDSRARDMILVSAENVSPTEVEYCLEAHPRVREAAVVAVDDAVTGDAVAALVVVDPPVPVLEDELEAHCRAALAHYKVPTVWLVDSEALPRTPSGKIIKSEVRARIDARRA